MDNKTNIFILFIFVGFLLTCNYFMIDKITTLQSTVKNLKTDVRLLQREVQTKRLEINLQEHEIYKLKELTKDINKIKNCCNIYKKLWRERK